MKAKISRVQFSWIHITALFLEYILAGWLLSAYNAPWFIWAGTGAVTLHLAWAGFDAVALAVAWMVGIVWAGAFAYAWPKSIPWVGVAVWAGALALIWILGVALALTLAKAQRAFESVGSSKIQVFWILVIIAYMGLDLGRILNSRLLLDSIY